MGFLFKLLPDFHTILRHKPLEVKLRSDRSVESLEICFSKTSREIARSLARQNQKQVICRLPRNRQ